MTVPMQYAHASEQFDRFMKAAQERLDHTTSHQTYQTVESVLRVFRRRLSVRQALDFANVLPAVLRAIFVENWRIDEPQRPFATMAEMNREVRAFRINHDFSPPTAIEDIAAVLRDHVDPVAFEKCLDRLGPEARAFWS